MRGAFVIRLGPETNPSSGHFEGSIEEVDSGKELKFQSSSELLRFLGECLQASLGEAPESGAKPTTPVKAAEGETRPNILDPSGAVSEKGGDNP